MIYFFTGRPGNGKSLHMAMIIYQELKKGKNVIANFEINERLFDKFRKKHPEKLGVFLYASNHDLLNNAYKYALDSKGNRKPPPKDKYSYIEGLYSYAEQFHKRNRRGQIIEGQTILVIDECQELFNSRSWNRSDRLEWCSFFRQHRKYGYDVYLISQDDKVIDKQIRSILQYEYEHRCVNNYKLFGKILGILSGGKLFVCIKKMYGVKSKDARIKSTFFNGQTMFYEFYDSYKTFDRKTVEESAQTRSTQAQDVQAQNT
ncbi:MAG: zonular occludens toxin domain-containing protein [Clostridiales bacterium]|nr:zonular occludens toxin domain-containing protein [Clostridiales bacterium]